MENIVEKESIESFPKNFRKFLKKPQISRNNVLFLKEYLVQFPIKFIENSRLDSQEKFSKEPLKKFSVEFQKISKNI